MATAHDVAAAIIAEIGPLDPMKLNKLLYYAQGLCVAFSGDRAFAETIEAWELGPVVPGVYRTYRGRGATPIERPYGGDPARLSVEQMRAVKQAVRNFGDLAGTELSSLTHAMTAWREAWERRKHPRRGDEPIDPEAIASELMTTAPRKPTEQEMQLAERALLGDADAFVSLLRG